MQRKIVFLHLIPYRMYKQHKMKTNNTPPRFARMLWVCLTAILLCSCSAGDEPDVQSTVENPTSIYRLSGKVVDEADDTQGLAGIQIYVAFEKPQAATYTLATTPAGNFEWEGPISTFDQSLSFTVTATDPTQTYQSKTTTLRINKNESQEENSWFYKELSKNIVIRLGKAGE